MKIGDLVTAYRPGIHKIIDIKEREEGTAPLIIYQTLINGSGNLEKSEKKHHCDAGFLGSVDDLLDELREKVLRFETNLKIIRWKSTK